MVWRWYRSVCVLVVLAGSAFAMACGGSPESACKPAPGRVCTIAGTGDFGFNDDGLAATKTDFYLPSAARRGPDELVYVMDFNNQRLRYIDEANRVQTHVGNGEHALAATGVSRLETPLENPIDFDFLSDGTLVFVSYHDPRVLMLDEDDMLRSLAGTGDLGVDGSEGDGSDALEALFIQPDGIEIGPDDEIYVSDSLAHRVRKIEDGIITTVAGNGARGYSGDGGPGVEAELFWPTALCLDDDGNLLIADARNHVVRRLDPEGVITTLVGTGEAGYSGDGGPADEAQLNQPTGLDFDEDGSLYIADRANFVVRKVLPDGTIETIAGIGEEGYAGDGGSALDAEFSYIGRVYRDGDSLFVADQGNSVVREIRLR